MGAGGDVWVIGWAMVSGGGGDKKFRDITKKHDFFLKKL